MGAGENDLNYAIGLATSQITNFSSAESQIRDADIATEAANLTKAQVLEQASVAAMAQANAAPQAFSSCCKARLPTADESRGRALFGVRPLFCI